MRRAAEIRQMTDAEIAQAIQEAKQEMFNLRIQWKLGQLEDYMRIRQLKREIARLLTIQHERRLAARLVQEDADA